MAIKTYTARCLAVVTLGLFVAAAYLSFGRQLTTSSNISHIVRISSQTRSPEVLKLNKTPRTYPTRSFADATPVNSSGSRKTASRQQIQMMSVGDTGTMVTDKHRVTQLPKQPPGAADKVKPVYATSENLQEQSLQSLQENTNVATSSLSKHQNLMNNTPPENPRVHTESGQLPHILTGHAAISTSSYSSLSPIEQESLFFRVKPTNVSTWTPMNYLPNYRSPCWKSQSSKCGIHCLPLIFLVGVTKSGTTDLYNSLTQHEDIAKPRQKEPMWWNRGTIKLYPKMASFGKYVQMFSVVTCQIAAASDPTTNYHHKITIDGTPAYLWDYDGWQNIPGNKGLSAPKYTLAASLRALIPKARIIAILRNPTKRIYSQFRMKSLTHSVQYFRNATVAAIKTFNKCLKARTLRHCAYNNSLVKDEFRRGLFYRASLYYVYVKDWLDVFPRSQMLVIRGEDYYSNRTTTMIEAYRFLQLDSPAPHKLLSLVKAKPANARITFKLRSQESMLPKTKQMLDAFYKPYNQKLAQLLRDDRFLWSHE